MSTHDTVRDAMLAALRSAPVAAVAGVSADVWAAIVSPRVVPVDSAGYLGMLHRGRLPMIEVFQDSEVYNERGARGGTVASTWSIRVNVIDKAGAESFARAILLTGLAALRASPVLELGDEAVQKADRQPLGLSILASVTCYQSFDRSTYEV